MTYDMRGCLFERIHIGTVEQITKWDETGRKKRITDRVNAYE